MDVTAAHDSGRVYFRSGYVKPGGSHGTGFDDSVKQALGVNPESLASLPHGHASRQCGLRVVFCTYTSEWLPRIVADFGRNTTIDGAMRGESLFVWDHM